MVITDHVISSQSDHAKHITWQYFKSLIAHLVEHKYVIPGKCDINITSQVI